MIYLLLADGFEEAEALVPLDLLRRAEQEVRTVGMTGKTVVGAHGIPVLADILPEEATEEISLLILPGGMPGTTNLDKNPLTDALISRTIGGGGRIAAICAAPSILGKRGLLSGVSATCFPGFEAYLEGARLSDAAVVTCDRFTTAVGMGAAFDFGIELVRLTAGEESAKRLAAMPGCRSGVC
jgi:4-methyl-5(b-hydroxyethyl)-thiazole monophosphate biosynthesis